MRIVYSKKEWMELQSIFKDRFDLTNEHFCGLVYNRDVYAGFRISRKSGDFATRLFYPGKNTNLRIRYKTLVNKKGYLNSFIVWCMSHNEPLPENYEIRHINEYTLDENNCASDQLSNLTIGTRSQNVIERGIKSNNTSGYRGVTQDGEKWTSYTRINGKRKHISRSTNKHEAGFISAEFIINNIDCNTLELKRQIRRSFISMPNELKEKYVDRCKNVLL